MRKEDKEKIETLLEKNPDEKLIVAHFTWQNNECTLDSSREIRYNSWNTILFQKIFDAENNDLKSIKILKEFFPTIKKVFAYYTCHDTGYWSKNEIESKGWKLIDERSTPMYETSCYFILAVPKKFKLNFDRNTIIDDVIING